VEQQVNLGTPQPDGLHRYWKSEFLATLPRQALEVFREDGARICSSADSQLILFQLGGAASEFGTDSTAFANRDAEHIVFVAGCWQPADPRRDEHMSWVRSTWRAIAPYGIGNYVNVQDTDEDHSRTAGAYHRNLERLSRVKAAYDPENFFRTNRNIAPAPPPTPADAVGDER
jgi:hypothetical protein